MDLLASTWSFTKRHRKKLAAGSATVAIVGGLYYYFYRSKKQVEDQRWKEFFIQRLNFAFSGSQRTAHMALRTLLAQTQQILCDDLMNLDDIVAVLKGEKEPTEALLSAAGIITSSATATADNNSDAAAPADQQQQQQQAEHTDDQQQQQQQPQQILPRKLSSDEKKKLWERIKVDGISRTMTAIYSVCLLQMLLSVQVNIIGRYLFLKHMHEERKVFMQREGVDVGSTTWPVRQQQQSNRSGGAGSSNEEVIDLSKDTQQQFLSFAGHFQADGVRQLLELVRTEVAQVVERVPLSQLCAPQDMYDMLEQVRVNVEKHFLATPTEEPRINLCSVLLPPEDSQDPNEMHPHLLDLLDELRDVLESEEFVHVFRQVATGGFAVLYRQLERIIVASKRNVQQPLSAAEQQQQPPPQAHLANIVPRIVKEGKMVFDNNPAGSTGNEYVQSMEENQLLTRFSFMIYSLGIDIDSQIQ